MRQDEREERETAEQGRLNEQATAIEEEKAKQEKRGHGDPHYSESS